MTQSARERMLSGLQASGRRVELAGVSTALLEAGDGPPLVLLHGGIECGGAYWAPVIERLAESHRVVDPDVPGLGESEPVADLTTEVFSDWFRALLHATCARIEAASCVAKRVAKAPSRECAISIGRSWQKNAERFDRFAFFDFDAAKRHNEDWLEAWSVYTRERAAVPHVKRTMRRLIKRCTKRIPDDELRRIDIPITLIWGSHDRFVPLSLAEGASARLDWPLRVIDETGHVPHIERTEAFLDALMESSRGSQIEPRSRQAR
jgi:pimeloyl-ACP methyl ester carboxylesterase